MSIHIKNKINEYTSNQHSMRSDDRDEKDKIIRSLKSQLVIARKEAQRAVELESTKDKYIARQYARLELVSKQYNIQMSELVKGVY